MNIVLSWLMEYVDIECDIYEFANKMAMAGSNVENIVFSASDIKNVVIGKIVDITNHPNADKLVICKIDVGTKILQIVTGAKNVYTGAIVPVALDGAVLANNLKIKKGKLRGEISEGMLCSVEELGFGRNEFPEAPENGIYIFEDEQILGEDAVKIFGIKDTIIEFELTSNRPDCYCILGMAKEVAAVFSKKIKNFELDIQKKPNNNLLKVNFVEDNICNRYYAKVIKNVKVDKSPLWLRRRLFLSGINPINNIVDITNYVMLLYGQPMHAFDFDKIEGDIQIRKAFDGEKIETLDGQVRILDKNITVIADSEKSLAVAGIIGGNISKINNNTKTVLFEAANFVSSDVKNASKFLGLRTDSSALFEKNIDPNLVEKAIEMAMFLVEKLCCGDILEDGVDVYKNKRLPWKVKYSFEKINKLIGTNLKQSEIIDILEKLDIVADNEYAYINTNRIDLQCEADLAEEVARIFGYENIIPNTTTHVSKLVQKSKNHKIKDEIKNILVSYGFCEIMNFSFESPKIFEKLLLDKDISLINAIKIINPLGEDYSIMKTNTINGMLTSIATNINRKNKDLFLFEICKIFNKNIENGILEKEVLTIACCAKDFDFFNLKGVIENLLYKLGIFELSFQEDKSISYMHPGRTACINIFDKHFGYLGQIHPVVGNNYDIDQKVYVAVLDINLLDSTSNLDKYYKPIAKYPSIKRDISLLVKNEILVKEVTEMISSNCGCLLKEVNFFDEYKGDQIQSDFKSLSFELIFRADDRTLKESEVNECIENVVQNLLKNDIKIRDK